MSEESDKRKLEMKLLEANIVVKEEYARLLRAKIRKEQATASLLEREL